jgi:hypothetical protein
VRCPRTGDDREFSIAIHSRAVKGGRERVYGIEVVALDPILQLTGTVSLILS